METAEEHESKTTNQPNGNHFSKIESFRALVGDSDANSLKEFIDKINSNDEDGVIVTNTSIVLSPSSDKVHRTTIQRYFACKLAVNKNYLRCTYRAYDAMDETIVAFLIGFNPSGTKIFAGYNKSIRIFDIHRPGRDFQQHSTIQGNKEGQSGSSLQRWELSLENNEKAEHPISFH
uniref:Uncharacterized protein n=1 Tax=Lactuca sativa TaxID=4236 RepID=A0A9R1VF26_LACSA|nr:hypothetical protein LSAT_V11C500261900 [Lactuca sativa]